jgi:hypothetical protein
VGVVFAFSEASSVLENAYGPLAISGKIGLFFTISALWSTAGTAMSLANIRLLVLRV